MAYEYDRFEREDGGGSFLMGLLAGTVLGAGLGMLFAPKAGSELRNQLSEQAGRLRTTANDAYRRRRKGESDRRSRPRSVRPRPHRGGGPGNAYGAGTGTTPPSGSGLAHRRRPAQPASAASYGSGGTTPARGSGIDNRG